MIDRDLATNSGDELPETIYVEVKLTTSTAVVVSARELAALQTTGKRAVGLLAALFWCGDRRVDGRWMVVDARESFGPISGHTLRVSKDDLARTMAHQRWLDGIKAHLERYWRPFLSAFLSEAMIGREALHKELARHHTEQTAGERLPEEVNEAEHRDHVAVLIEHHEEVRAGQLFQDLFAYLLGHAGYQRVTTNPVGVPDITVSHLRRSEAPRRPVYIDGLEVDDVRRAARHCRAVGDHKLAARLLTSIGDEVAGEG